MKKHFILTIFLGLALNVFAQQKSKKTIIKEIPQVSLYNIKGKTTDLKSISKNKITFIDFWFVPCSPCFKEMSMLHRIYAKYKNNPNVTFLTISTTDSAFVRPLIENRNSPNNDTYSYFKELSGLKKFQLPVYFIKNATNRSISFKKGNGYSGQSEPNKKDPSSFPDHIFGFSKYPSIFIFDKNGKVIYKKTGFLSEGEKKQQKEIETLIDARLTK